MQHTTRILQVYNYLLVKQNPIASLEYFQGFYTGSWTKSMYSHSDDVDSQQGYYVYIKCNSTHIVSSLHQPTCKEQSQLWMKETTSSVTDTGRILMKRCSSQVDVNPSVVAAAVVEVRSVLTENQEEDVSPSTFLQPESTDTSLTWRTTLRVGWSLTSLFSTNMALSETKGQGCSYRGKGG